MLLEFFSRSSNSCIPGAGNNSPFEALRESPQKPARQSPAAAVLISLLVLLIYLSTLTSDYYWDGITFALQIDKVTNGERGAELLFHQNHLLYNAIGYLVNLVADAFGLSTPTINLLQITNAFAGALAIGIFFRMAERATRNRYAAIVCSLALAISAARWKVATDADAYALTMLLILVCASNLFSERPRWVVAGLALAGAMLVHQLGSLFFPAALVAVFSSPNIERKTTFAVRMTVLAWTVAISGYYLCAVLLHNIVSPLGVLKWVTSNPSEKSLASSPVTGILLLPKINFDAIAGHNFALFRRAGESVELAVALGALITALIFVFIVIRKVNLAQAVKSLRQCAPEMEATQRQLLPVIVTWVGAYLLFLIFWGPLIYFRAFYTAALALGFGLALSNYHLRTRSRPSGAAALAVATLALFNLSFYILPNMRADSNVLVAAARNTRGVWNERTVIYFANRNEADTAFEYFNDAAVWRRLTSTAKSRLESEIDRVNTQGGEVWLNRGAIEMLGAEWLARHKAGNDIVIEAPNAPARYVRVLPEQ